MAVTIEKAGLAHATYVAAYLRQRDAVELQALFGTADLTTIIAGVMYASPYAYVALDNGNPVMVFGVLVFPLTPQHGVAWGHGTDKAWRAIPTVGRFIKEQLIPELMAAGLHRVEVRAMSDNTASTHWLAHYMGARHEAVLWDFGVKREKFQQFAWLRSDFEHVWI